MEKKTVKNSLIACVVLFFALSSWYLYRYFQLSNQTINLKGLASPVDHTLIKLIVSSYFFFSFMLMLLGFLYARKARQWWVVSYTISFLALLGLISIWYIAHHQGLDAYDHYLPLTSEQSLQQALDTYANGRIQIPTGIFIEHLSFLAPGGSVYPGLALSGFMWQRYKIPEHNNIQRGFIFGDAGKIDLLKELYKTKTNNEEIICWQFSALLFQRFEDARFPFDHRHTIIHILHPEFMNNIMLTPDFAGYNHGGKRLFGHSNLFQIPHWKIDKTFFSFHIYDFDEDFSLPNFKKKNFPQLCYYFISERDFVDSAVIYLMMLFASAVILFITLLAFLKEKKLVNLLGFSTLSIIGVGSGLLFVLISTHSEIRQNLAVDGTAYMEYLFVIVYLAIIAISINALIFTLRRSDEDHPEKNSIFPQGHNMLVKLLYWPSILTAMLLVTAWTFY